MELEKFCFCCKLRKGAFIWSILSICFNLILLITTVSSDLIADKISTENATALDSRHETYKTIFYWTLLVSFIIHLISSILLTIGVWKVRYLPFLIYYYWNWSINDNLTEKSLPHVALDYCQRHILDTGCIRSNCFGSSCDSHM